MIHRRPQAVAAIIDQAAYIGQDNPAAAERFLDAVETTFADLEKTPRLGRSYESEHPRLMDLRVWRVKGFPKYLSILPPRVRRHRNHPPASRRARYPQSASG